VHSGCDQSAGDADSSMAPDPTSGLFRCLCTPIFLFVFPIGLMRLITDRYFLSFHSKKSSFLKSRFWGSDDATIRETGFTDFYLRNIFKIHLNNNEIMKVVIYLDASRHTVD
jgi:hypothetical protein